MLVVGGVEEILFLGSCKQLFFCVVEICVVCVYIYFYMFIKGKGVDYEESI